MKLKYKALVLTTVSLNALNAFAAAIDLTGTVNVNPAVDYPAATQFNIGSGAQVTFTGDVNVPVEFPASSGAFTYFADNVKLTALITTLGADYSGNIIFNNNGAEIKANIGAPWPLAPSLIEFSSDTGVLLLI